MYGDYGYMEEGKLGKPYDVKLLKRLLPFARSSRKGILTALAVSLLITAVDLAAPYISKVAIDRYIIATWYEAEANAPPEAALILDRYASRFVVAQDGRRFLSHEAATEMDPADALALKQAGVLFANRFLRVPENDATVPLLLGIPGQAALSGNEVMVPAEAVARLPLEDRAVLRARDLSGVLAMGLILLAFTAAVFFLSYLEFNLLERAGQAIMLNIRTALFDRMISQSLAFFHLHPVGRLVTRVTNDVENLNELFKSVLVTVFKDVFILAGIMGVMLAMDVHLALVCFALIPPVFALAIAFSSLSRDAFRSLRSAVARMNAFLQERLSGMRAIQFFAVERAQMALFTGVNEENYETGMRQIRIFAVFLPLMEFLSSLGVALLIWHGGARVLSDQVTLGTLVAFVTYMRMFFRPLRDLSEKYNIMQSAMASTERIFEFMDTDMRLPEPAGPAPEKVRGEVVFSNVSFAYEPGRPVLENVSFTIPPGRMVALVGRTGSGKTTCAHLLTRFFDPGSGRVTLDGADLKHWPATDLRQRVALVQQDVFLFAGTLRDNITMGQNEDGEGRLREALEKAGAWPFIQRLPKGLDEPVAEGGTNLSAGQRQLLAFARALYADPKVLILDEATSSVDPETERAI
ncbi:MAG: ABC transporter ATP-binding protein/permease, partial [Proteobacteria bacterium]|nr:ABC transporter ATP-binding protein/permease [Pseudomonadota bacterium]